ncbi:hypothetical protein ACRWXY_21450, partial [Escherichia coli]
SSGAGRTADRNRSHWSTSKTPSYTKSVSWQHHPARDNWNYIPLPVLLPLASVGYGPVTFQMTYIPGTYNNGNVYFAWMRFQF